MKFDLRLFLLFVLIELLIGILIGWIIMAKKLTYSHIYSDKYKFFAKNKYISKYYTNNYPESFFNAFGMEKYNFIFVKYNQNQLVSETFYTWLGTSAIAHYHNGEYISTTTSVFTSPLFIFTVFIPGLLGSQLESFDRIGLHDFRFYLQISASSWFVGVFWFPVLVPALIKKLCFVFKEVREEIKKEIEEQENLNK
ncbi:MAG: hypothetical protein ACRC1Z_14450 [Waterburya sp.]